MLRIGALIAVLVAAAFVGCQANVQRDEIAGTYRLKYPYGIMHLIIKLDGTYQQLFGKTGEPLVLIKEGKWKLIRASGETNLDLFEAALVDDGFGTYDPREATNGSWLLRVRRSLFGRIYLPVNEDQGFEFTKLKNWIDNLKCQADQI